MWQNMDNDSASKPLKSFCPAWYVCLTVLPGMAKAKVPTSSAPEAAQRSKARATSKATACKAKAAPRPALDACDRDAITAAAAAAAAAAMASSAGVAAVAAVAAETAAPETPAAAAELSRPSKRVSSATTSKGENKRRRQPAGAADGGGDSVSYKPCKAADVAKFFTGQSGDLADPAPTTPPTRAAACSSPRATEGPAGAQEPPLIHI